MATTSCGILSAKVESEEAARKLVQSLCSSTEDIDDEYFVDLLVAELSAPAATSEFVTFITKSTNKSSLRALCQRLSQGMDRCNGADALEWRIILLISLLGSMPTLRLSNDESRKWIAFVTRSTFVDAISLKTALATILACPNLMPDQTSFKIDDQVRESLISFFKRIHGLIQSTEYNSLTNMMILVYVHLITDNAADLAALLSSVLGRKVPKTLHKQSHMKGLYIAQAIQEQDVVEKAANISITKDLCASTNGYLPAHCISHLLHWRSFSKYSTPIQEWIKSQLTECRAPIHSIIPTLLENFASSCIPNEEFAHFNEPIDESFFKEIFSGQKFDESRLVIRVIALTYLFAYTYKLDTAPCQKDLLTAMNHRAPKPYSQSLWKAIPIRYFLIMIDQRYLDFQHIRPTLLRYVVLSMPHLLPEQAHFDVFKSSHHHEKTRKSLPSITEFTGALDEIVSLQKFDRFAKAINLLLEHATVEQQFFYYDAVMRAMVASLEGNWPRVLLDKLSLVWERFDSVVPSRLHEDTIRLWLSTPQSARIPQLDERDQDFIISHVPLILFRADSRIFRSPPHLRCFCRTLSFYLAASKDANFLRLARAAVHNSKSEMEEKDTLLRSFIGTQRLAVVQTFIELCDGELEDNVELEEIRQILCSQIHQFFIADAHLPKLVHFNMYPLRLIPVILQHVPSTHVLINSIGELITGGNLERRIFAVVLITELLQRYKIPSAFAALTLISDMLDTMLATTITDSFIVLMLNITPSLARLIHLSPFHAEYFIATLERTRTLAMNRLALYTSLTQARTSPEQRLIELISRRMEDFPKLPE